MRLPRTDQGNKPPDESDLKETRLQRSEEVRLDLAGDKALTRRVHPRLLMCIAKGG